MLRVPGIYTQWMLIAAVVCDVLGAVADPQVKQQAEHLLSAAYEKAGKGDQAGADGVYQKLIICCPDAGFPAYARFVSRTGQTTAVEELVTSNSSFASQTPLVKPRAMVSARKRPEAIELLTSP